MDPGKVGDPTTAGLVQLRRLTAREYLNTVRDLLADTTLGSGDVPSEADDRTNNAFPFRQPSFIGEPDAKALQGAAEQLATNVAAKLSTLLPCNPTTAAAEPACATQVINTFGQKVYRRPVTTGEAADLQALYTVARSAPLSLDFKGAAGMLIEAMLQSPGFIYHWELDPGAAVRAGNLVQLGNYQIANRLSYFLWGTMPDAALFTAAAAGQLSTPAGVETQTRRMLADPKMKDTLADFFDDWLDTNTLESSPKDPAVYPEWNNDLADSMENEVRAYGSASFTTGSFVDLMTGVKSNVNQSLGAIYGLSGINTTTMQAATFDPTQRAGLFTLAGFLTVDAQTDGSSPIRRGHAIYERLLCQSVPPPPNAPASPALPPGATTRATFEVHDMNPCTGACHKAMDPIGFGFEKYDGVGKYRTTETAQKLPVDASGTINLDGKDQPFADGVALAKILSNSLEVQTCFTAQWLRYATNRWTTDDDLASIQGAAAILASKLDMREMLVGLTTSRTFRFRTPASGETVQ
jgi:hypothetical protein